MLGHLAKVKERVEFVACTLPVEDFGLQRWAAKHLQDSIPMSTIDDCLAKRLTTFLREEVSPTRAAIVRSRILAAKGFVPQCAVASVLRTICNAWTTTGRFSGDTAVCPFGCGALGGDRFSHFPVCAFLREMWKEVCPGATEFFSSLSISTITLTTHMMSQAEVVQAILWSDVVGQCLNDARAENPPRIIQGASGKDMIIARLRFLGVQCDSTRYTIQGMRSVFIAA